MIARLLVVIVVALVFGFLFLLECGDPSTAGHPACEALMARPAFAEAIARVRKIALAARGEASDSSRDSLETKIPIDVRGANTGAKTRAKTGTGDPSRSGSDGDLPQGHVFGGQAVVVDGDSIELGGHSVRLHGIDAPELHQRCERPSGTKWPCGQYASVALDQLIDGRDVSCRVLTTDRYHRPVSRCHVGDTDLGQRMVVDGWALAYVRYSKEYVEAEARARAAEAGVWSGEIVPPWQWRLQRAE